MGRASASRLPKVLSHAMTHLPLARFSIVYGKHGQRGGIWNVNDWGEDIADELSADAKNHRRTLVVSNSAASQALLRAAVNLHKRQLYTDPSVRWDQQLEGVLMVSPGVGMELENYMERIMPGSVDKLRQGEGDLEIFPYEFKDTFSASASNCGPHRPNTRGSSLSDGLRICTFPFTHK